MKREERGGRREEGGTIPWKVYSGGKEISEKVELVGILENEIGIFESLRTYGDRIFRERDHLERFLESARTAGQSSPLLTAKQLHRELELALKAFFSPTLTLPRNGGGENLASLPLDGGGEGGGKDAFVRLTWWQNRIWVMVGRRKHPEAIYRRGVVLKTSPVKRSHSNASPPEAKTTAYQNALLASLEPRDEKIYEWLFLDANGYVTEVRIGNLFLIRDGIAFTPPIPGILNGITRRVVIECALQAGMGVKEIPLARHEVFNADEAFLTNTSWEILPVRELDGRRIGSRCPGPVTLKLHNLFKRKTEESS